MLVKLLLPQTDEDARCVVANFKRDGIASLSTDGMHYGFVREVGEEDGKIMIVADATEPELVKWIKENIGDDEPIEMDLSSYGSDNAT